MIQHIVYMMIIYFLFIKCVYTYRVYVQNIVFIIRYVLYLPYTKYIM